MTTQGSIFSRKNENIMLWLPVLFLPLLTLELGGFISYGEKEMLWLFFLANTLLFNVTHQAMTLTLFFLPELQGLIAKKYPSHRRFWIEMIAVHVICCALIYYLSIWLRTGSELYTLVTLGSILLFLVLPQFHIYAQCSGIAAIYDANDGRIHRDSGRERKIEKLLFYAIFASAVPLMFVRNMLEIESSYIRMLEFIGAGVATIAIAYLFYRNIVVSPASKRKLFYLSRLWFIPFSAFANTPGVFLSGMHGMEYASLSWNMLQKSEASSDRKRSALLFFFCYGSVVIFFCSFRSTGGLIGIAAIDPFDFYTKLFTTISIGCGLAHYYVDYVIFRLRDPINRAQLKSLLQ